MAETSSEKLSKKWVSCEPCLPWRTWVLCHSELMLSSTDVQTFRLQLANGWLEFEYRRLFYAYWCIIIHYYCSELKRRLKAEQKLKEKAEKAAQAPAPAATDKKTSKAAEEEISPNEYYKLRSAAVATLKQGPKENHPYPHKFNVTISLENFIEKYNTLDSGEVLDSVTLSLAGRVHSIRESGAKLIFYDLRGEGVKIQVTLILFRNKFTFRSCKHP